MWLYQLLIHLLAPLIVFLIALDTRKRTAHSAEFWQAFKQRVGWKLAKFQFTQPPIWIHCASVGEFKAAEVLIQQLQAQQQAVMVSVNTPTAAQLLRQTFPNLAWCYLPFDWPFAIQRFLQQFEIKPKALWIIETEIWPNLYRLSHTQAIPILILNGRLTQKTLNSPNWLKKIYRQTLSYLDQVLARNLDEAKKFEVLGVAKAKIQVLGNLKFANLKISNKSCQNPQPRLEFLPKNRSFILLASSHPDEEIPITQAWLQLKRPELLVIVPRHPQRGVKIQQQLQSLITEPHQLGLYSQAAHCSDGCKVFIVDTIGQLDTLYACAKLVIMGGSFVPKGGHNFLEAAAKAKPILTGPDMSDFEKETEQFKQAQGLIQVSDYPNLIKELKTLLQHPEQAETLGKNALKAAQQTQQQILKAYLTTLLDFSS